MWRILTAGGVLVALTCSSGAHADKMDETLDISLSSRFAWLQIHDEMQVAPAAEEVDVLTNARPHLRGSGPLMGGTLRLGFTLDGVRFGAGLGVVTASGFDFQHEPLADGFSMSPGNIWGAPIEGYLGYTIGDSGGVRGIFDVRGALTILQSNVTLKHETLGNLGDTPLNVYLGSLEIRLGVRIPVDKVFYLEGGLGISPLPAEIAPERGSLFFAVGLPVPTSHAF